MRDRLKRVIYVGKARDLRKRLSHYFTPSRTMRADPKTRALVESIWEFEWHIVRSEAEAVLYEGRLIKEFRPKYNVSFRDDKRFLLVRVNLNDPWPKFQLTRSAKGRRSPLLRAVCPQWRLESDAQRDPQEVRCALLPPARAGRT